MSDNEATSHPPLPPNWNEHLEETIASLAPYKLFPIAKDTLEYATLTAMMHPLNIVTAEQIVNPNLWLRFINTRKYMLLTKSDDLKLISKFALAEKQFMQQMHISLSVAKDAQLAACPYNDNLALLFHCTRSVKNVDSILIQGLDERVGNGGCLGKGIYFADNPQKSIVYDGSGSTMLVFMVLLGDCLSVDHLNSRQTFVREPEKQRVQQRNLNDIHFDSIAGRLGNYSEYVVFNRYQCCPLYKIQYKSNSTHTDNIYSQSRNRLPPFSWIPNTSVSIPMPSQSTNINWPFYAKSIFTQMGVQQVDDEIISELDASESAESIENKLTILTNLGFINAEMNLEALKKNSYDLDRSVNHLLELGAMIDQPSESEILNNNRLAMLSNLGITDAELNSETVKNNPSDLDKKVKHLLEIGGCVDQHSEHKILRRTLSVSTDWLRQRNTSESDNADPVETLESAESIRHKLAILKNLGFTNAEMNSESLKKNSYNLDRSVIHLLEVGPRVNQLSESDILCNNMLATLSNLGFTDNELNLQTLNENSFDLERSVNHLLGLSSEVHLPLTSQILNAQMGQAEPGPNTYFGAVNDASTPTTTSSTSPQSNECLICRNEYEKSKNNWIVLQCSHKVCTRCYKQIETKRTTMGGVKQTFIKCPFCMDISGVEIGICPDGTMKTSVLSTPCEGYERFGTICINYNVKDPKYGTSRIAYLPNNDEGNEVLKLLQIAWDRRLCFTIGNSGTTGQNNVLIWNIHHKSSQRGGVQSHGFPDDNYMKRAKLELKAYGIE